MGLEQPDLVEGVGMAGVGMRSALMSLPTQTSLWLHVKPLGASSSLCTVVFLTFGVILPNRAWEQHSRNSCAETNASEKRKKNPPNQRLHCVEPVVSGDGCP